MRVKPNREKIRAVLGTTSVLELQRQLLTTVMENEVYKTQVARVTDGWHGKIDEFEKINQGLHDSLSKLRDENELLRLKVEQKSIELEGTRARLRQLERSHEEPRRQKELSGRIQADNYVKLGGEAGGGEGGAAGHRRRGGHRQAEAAAGRQAEAAGDGGAPQHRAAAPRQAGAVHLGGEPE